MLEKIKEALKRGAKEFGPTAIQHLLWEINKYKQANLIRIAGWKGKSGIGLVLSLSKQTYITIEYRQDKHTGDVKEVRHEIPFANVELMKEVLKMFEKEKITYREIVNMLIKKRKFSVDFESFNGGGGNRAEYYFPHYYYPLKILEHDKLIHYSGRGVIKI